MFNPTIIFRHFIVFASVIFLAYSAHAQLTFTVTNTSGSYSLTCNNPTITLYASSSYTTSAPVTYVWNNSSSSISSASVSLTTPAYYTVTATSGVLTAKQTFTLWNNLTPPSVSSSGPVDILSCSTPSTSVQYSSTPSTTFSWLYQNSAPVAVSNTGFTVNANYTLSPTNTLVASFSLTVTDTITGCLSRMGLFVYQNIYPPHAVIATGSITALTCNTPSLYLTNNSNSGIPANSYFPIFGPVTTDWIGPLPQPTTSLSSSYAVFTPGIYTMTATDSNNGCMSSTVITIGDNRIYPIVTTNNVYVLDCPNGVVMLPASTNMSASQVAATWIVPVGANISGANTLTLTTNTAGEYSLTVKDYATGCEVGVQVSVWACVGLEEHNTPMAQLAVFPNPAKNEFSIQSINSSSETADLSIRNGLGQLVFSKTDADLNEKISIQHLETGVYYLTVKNDLGQKVFKIIKQ